MLNETHQIIQEYAFDIASQAGVQLSKVAIVEGRDVGCLDTHLLKLIFDDQIVSILVYKSDLDNLQSERCCIRLERKIRSALAR